MKQSFIVCCTILFTVLFHPVQAAFPVHQFQNVHGLTASNYKKKHDQNKDKKHNIDITLYNISAYTAYGLFIIGLVYSSYGILYVAALLWLAAAAFAISAIIKKERHAVAYLIGALLPLLLCAIILL